MSAPPDESISYREEHMFEPTNPTTWSDADWAAAFAFADDAPRVDDGDALEYVLSLAA